LVTLGVIGCGYWGPNLVRNFTQLSGAEVKTCVDLSPERLDHMRNLYPTVEVSRDYKSVLKDEEIQAVVIATPVSTHFAIARDALLAGKHVFIEKPITRTFEEGLELIRLSSERGLTLMVGHTFVYNAAVRKIKELIESGELGEIFYISTTRVNLGLFQEDINVIWDLAPHDISILNFVLSSRPERVSATAHSYIQPRIEDVAFFNLWYPNQILGNVHVSWLNPNKIRLTTVVGSKKMLVYDDVSSLEKIRIYDKGVTVQPHYDTFGEFHLAYRFGDIFIPRLDDAEPLKVECTHFLECLGNGKSPRSDGTRGTEVVRVLEAVNDSIRRGGESVPVEYPES
jgi:predicted dehydrogenase